MKRTSPSSPAVCAGSSLAACAGSSLAILAGLTSTLLILAILVPLPAIAVEADTIRIDVDTLPARKIVSLGEFPADQGVTASIALRSQLGKPLHIRSVATDCGCLRADHDPEKVTSDGAAHVRLLLAPSSKAGRIRRNLRIHFAEEPSKPLDLGLDTVVVAPIALDAEQIQLHRPAEVIELTGIKKEPNLELLDCLPARGSCRVVAIEQSPRQFTLRIRPLIAFGSANEVFRIRYRREEEAEASLIELPLELRCVSPLRFFPSVTPIQFDQGAWCASAKLVIAPGNPVDLERLQLTVERADGGVLKPSEFKIQLQASSVVLHTVRVRCVTPNRSTDRPVRLNVASPEGQRLASLDFSNP